MHRDGRESVIVAFFVQDNLLLINHAKLMYQKSWNGGKEYMVSALFRYLDLDGNGFLHRDELEKVQRR